MVSPDTATYGVSLRSVGYDALMLRMLRLFAVALLVITTPCMSSERDHDNVSGKCVDGRLLEAFNANGWDIPGIADVEIRIERAKWNIATDPKLLPREKVWLAVLK